MTDDDKKNATQDIPKEVLEQLPDSVKAELGVETSPQKKEGVFSSEEARNITEGMNRMSTAFEKIGLTLIGRMGEFATTLERIMMIVARIEKVENLVAEMKYFMKGLQKTLDGLQRSVDNVSNMDVSAELSELKKISEYLAPAPPPPKPKNFIDEFKKFLESYKVIGLAVAFIMGIYLGSLVQAVVTSFPYRTGRNTVSFHVELETVAAARHKHARVRQARTSDDKRNTAAAFGYGYRQRPRRS